MLLGRGFAADGSLQIRAQIVARERGVSTERAGQLARRGSEIGQARADRYRADRELRARDLGYRGLDDYLRRRYVGDRATVEDLMAELDAGYSAVRGDMRRAGVSTDRSKPRRRKAAGEHA